MSITVFLVETCVQAVNRILNEKQSIIILFKYILCHVDRFLFLGEAFYFFSTGVQLMYFFKEGDWGAQIVSSTHNACK